MSSESFVKLIVNQFTPCVCHIDYAKCEHPECVSYRVAIGCVVDSMTKEQAINAIVSNSDLTLEKAKFHVSKMIELGFLDETS